MWSLLLAAALQAPLDRILTHDDLRGATVGAIVTTLDGTVLYERNSDLRLMPASNQKLLSVSYALHALGPDFRPQTRIWRLADRIAIDAPGDPSLSLADLQAAAAKVRFSDVAPIAVRQAYRVGVPSTWEHDDLPNRYAPQIMAFSFDRGAFQLYAENGKPVLVPESFGVTVRHFPGGVSLREYDPFKKLMIVRGDLPKARTFVENFALPEPDKLAAGVFGGVLVPLAELPASLPTLTITGKSVGEMAKECLVPSDNYVAEHLFLMAAGLHEALPNNVYAEATKRWRGFLVGTAGLDERTLTLYDGSGMSRHNLVTAASIAKLLRWAQRQPWSDLWMDALASPGNGTLSSRLQGSSFRGKTGSLDMVSSLSGYVRTPSGQTLVVSLLMNHFSCPTAQARKIQDEFIRELEKMSSIGTVIDTSWKYEGALSEPGHRALDGSESARSGPDRSSALQGPHRRVEPSHAPPARKKRVAVRLG
ncbi:MAG: D-alanyl-D-alanine carboxypeptidase [Fimbriimonadaceae bacterium]|nr:MAG: D-alanyl-D-alanine carboxypeptidase [Fimbriimonadaceae bacterium]